MTELSPTAPSKLAIIALINCDTEVTSMLEHCALGNVKMIEFKNEIEFLNKWDSKILNIAAVISQSEVMAPAGVSLLGTLKNQRRTDIPFFILCRNFNEQIKTIALEAGVAEVFHLPFKLERFETRFNFIIKHWNKVNNKSKEHASLRPIYKTPVWKRVFDIVLSSIALIILSPIFIIVAILIRLESKGPVFYYALRVGQGYQIFRFYKFRSMYFDSDKKLKALEHLNQYSNQQNVISEFKTQEAYEYLCEDCRTAGVQCQFPIYSDTSHMCEKEYMEQKKRNGTGAFIKIKDDPRMTKVGKFIRKTSIDELPQLVNVLIGNMSIVGNRPLPLYEAEKLTTDKYALRFMAPAGITGLWQVKKRGNTNMSEKERLMLDNIYAKNNSFFNDIVLILKTIPALFQKENV